MGLYQVRAQKTGLRHNLKQNLKSQRVHQPMTRMLLSWSTPSIFDSSWLTTVSWTAVLPATEPRALQMASISSKMMMCSPLFGPIYAHGNTHCCMHSTTINIQQPHKSVFCNVIRINCFYQQFFFSFVVKFMEPNTGISAMEPHVNKFQYTLSILMAIFQMGLG